MAGEPSPAPGLFSTEYLFKTDNQCANYFISDCVEQGENDICKIILSSKPAIISFI